MFGLKIAINAVDNTTGLLRGLDGRFRGFARGVKQALSFGGLAIIARKAFDGLDRAMSASAFAESWEDGKKRISYAFSELWGEIGNMMGSAYGDMTNVFNKMVKAAKVAVENMSDSFAWLGGVMTGGLAGGESAVGANRAEREVNAQKQYDLQVKSIMKANGLYEEELLSLQDIKKELAEINKLAASGKRPEALQRLEEIIPKAKKALEEEKKLQKLYAEARGATGKKAGKGKDDNAPYRVSSRVGESYLGGAAPSIDIEMNESASMSERSAVRKQRAEDSLAASKQSRGLSGVLPSTFKRPERHDWTAETFSSMSAEQLQELAVGPSSNIKSAIKGTKASAKKQKKYDQLVSRGKYLASKGVDIEDMAPKVRAAMESEGKKEAGEADKKHLANIDENTKDLPELMKELMGK
jgi:hypothetical protein